MDNESQMAATAMEFMKRCRLEGGEVPAFINVSNWLQAKLNTSGQDRLEVADDTESQSA